MTRNRRSAKAAGATFERQVADWLRDALGNEYIDRKPRGGAFDTGDIGGVRTAAGDRVVVECKNTSTMSLPQWVREAQTEAVNDRALVGVVVHKRHGTTNPGDQWVSMTLADLAALLTGDRRYWTDDENE